MQFIVIEGHTIEMLQFISPPPDRYSTGLVTSSDEMTRRYIWFNPHVLICNLAIETTTVQMDKVLYLHCNLIRMHFLHSDTTVTLFINAKIRLGQLSKCSVKYNSCLAPLQLFSSVTQFSVSF